MGIPDLTRLSLAATGFNPEQADLKMGPLYFKLNALTAAILASDNPDHTDQGADPDAIAIVRLAATIVAQFSESLRFAVSGSVIWLPFEGKIGLSSGSLLDGVQLRDLFRAQIAWESHLGEWDLYLSDTFHVYPEATSYDFALYEGTDFDARDRMGSYSYGAYNYVSRFDRRRDSSFNTLTDQALVYSNEVAGVAERLLPGPVRLRIRAYHEDLYYNQGARGAPILREGASVLLRSERAEWRFNPYVRYELTRSRSDAAFSQYATAGLYGPITDQLELTMYAGWYKGGDGQADSAVGGLRLDHVAGPYTRESLFFGREIREFDGESFDNIRYNIIQTLGPHMWLRAYVSYGISTNLRSTADQRNEFSTGAVMEWQLGPRTDLGVGYGYREYSSNSNAFLFGDGNTEESGGGYTIQTIHFSLGYRITDTLRAHLLYRFFDQESSINHDSFQENLLLLSLTKYFE